MTSDDDKAILLKVSEVCQLLQLGRARVYELVAMKELGHIRDRRKIRIPSEAVNDWIRRKPFFKCCNGRNGGDFCLKFKQTD